eukprot:14445-Heterococcus_DN1.PRE.8
MADTDTHMSAAYACMCGTFRNSICMSGDGSFLFTAGGSDLTINAWRVDTNAMDAQAQAAVFAQESEGSSCYIDQLDGGKNGALYNELVDYFYYSQLRAQGEDCTEERATSAGGSLQTSTVPLSELPHLMRALGYYPSEQELLNMTNEVKYSEFTVTGEIVTAVDLHTLVKLFTNHRPVFPVGKAMLADAFSALGCDVSSGKLSWQRLCTMLKGDGKSGSSGGMSDEELHDCLEALTGEANTRIIGGKTAIDANEFAEHVLGFEDTAWQQYRSTAATTTASTVMCSASTAVSGSWLSGTAVTLLLVCDQHAGAAAASSMTHFVLHNVTAWTEKYLCICFHSCNSLC